MTTLADRAAIPFVVARYWPDLWAFEVRAVNDLARNLIGDQKRFSEAGYVRWLHQLRSLTVERIVLRHLRTEEPPLTDAA